MPNLKVLGDRKRIAFYLYLGLEAERFPPQVNMR